MLLVAPAELIAPVELEPLRYRTVFYPEDVHAHDMIVRSYISAYVGRYSKKKKLPGAYVT